MPQDLKEGITMKDNCPNCEKATKLSLIKETENLEIRGETINVEVEYFKCAECGEKFENSRGHDALDIAFREYRRRHDMLQPKMIRDWRKSKGLTQRELSDLLGWGGATISRYENGALQVEAHEKVLRLAMEPHNLVKLVEESPRALASEKRNRLIAELHAAEQEACSFESMFEERFGNYEPDEFSGFQKFGLSKIFNAILYFCKDAPLKTKLNKLLFYADFKHFKEYTVSITGAKYVHLQYGPVPNNYEFFTAELIRESALMSEEEMFGDYSGTKYKSLIDANLSIFNDTELKVLAEINEYFKSFNSSKIKDFSHKELAYTSTHDGESISYMHARDLQI